MYRFLLNVAYIGTRYNGVTKNVKIKDNYSIEDAMTQALARVIRNCEAEIHASSRTDAGVHATNTTFALDLSRNVPAWKITKGLNATFQTWHEQIRVLKSTPVTNEFDVRRYAISRSYLYRFAVCKERVPQGVSPKVYKSSMFVPIEESFRCLFVLNEGFDIERLKEAAKQMEGIHDFRSFMKISKEQRTFAPRFCLRKMHSIEVKPGNTIATSVNYEKTMTNFDFWNIEFKSRAYFYRQIRHMVGTMIAAANGRITQRDIYEMLTIPSKNSWHPKIVPASSSGLYLSNVEYLPEHMAKFARTSETVTDVKETENEMLSCDDDFDDENEGDRNSVAE